MKTYPIDWGDYIIISHGNFQDHYEPISMNHAEKMSCFHMFPFFFLGGGSSMILNKVHRLSKIHSQAVGALWP